MLTVLPLLLVVAVVVPFGYSFSVVRSIENGGRRGILSTNGQQRNSALRAAQLLEFVEPTTGVRVKLVGSMHYNPHSIELARRTCMELAEGSELGSVVIESCDIRWNASAYEELNPAVQKLLYSEMRAAHDVAMAFGRPVVLGDQRINITIAELGNGLKQTLQDVIRFRWNILASNITLAREEALPLGDNRYLGAFDFLDLPLLFSAPVAFFKYPFSFVARSPLTALAVFSFLFFGELSDVANAAGGGGYGLDQMTAADWAEDLGTSLLETVFFARVFLKELLVDRNEVIAKNILDQCKLYQLQEQAPKKPFWDQLVGFIRGNEKRCAEAVYAEGSTKPRSAEATGEKTVVAVLGMAHCNGVMKLLLEQRV